MTIIKTTIRLLLACLLLVSGSGIPVVIHHCGGEIESVRLFATTSSCDGDDGCEDQGCCTNTVVVNQLSIDATQNMSIDLPRVQVVDLMLPSVYQHSMLPLLSSRYDDIHTARQHLRPPPLLFVMRC